MYVMRSTCIIFWSFKQNDAGERILEGIKGTSYCTLIEFPYNEKNVLLSGEHFWSVRVCKKKKKYLFYKSSLNLKLSKLYKYKIQQK